MTRWLVLVSLLGGCIIGNNRYPKPVDLSPTWYVDRTRVLAVRAEPPEIRPGETASFEALIVNPFNLRKSVAWIACEPDSPGGEGFGCTIDTSLDFENATPEDFEEAGIIGFTPLIPPRYTAPLDLLDNATDPAEGVYVLIQTAVLPGDVLTDGFGDDIDFNDVEVAYKRLVVSEAASPNLNPAVVAVTINGYELPSGTIFEAEAGFSYEVGVVIDEATVETYTYVNRDGASESRVEEPWARWYADGGDVEEDITLYPYTEATWRAPDPDEGRRAAGSIWAVVRDRRGGMTWAEIPWRVRGYEAPVASPTGSP